MSLCALIYSKITKMTSVDDMTQIMIVGIQLYSCLSLLARQSMSMLTELPGMVTVFEQFFHLEYSDSYTCNIHHYCICHSQVTAFETLLALNYNSFILTVCLKIIWCFLAFKHYYEYFYILSLWPPEQHWATVWKTKASGGRTVVFYR